MKRCLKRFLWCCVLSLLLALPFAATAGAKRSTPQIKMSIDSLLVNTGMQGFHPSKGNYVMIRCGFTTKTDVKTSFKLRIRVLNAQGQSVFTKSYKRKGSSSIQYKWYGKASKGNKAGLQKGSYIGDGVYTVEAVLSCTGSGKSRTTPVKRTRTLTVSGAAPSGLDGLASVINPPLLTGNDNVDYMAEQMLLEAGVCSDQSDEQKVKNIYHYMTTHFHHVHYSKSGKYKVYYNMKKLRKKVRAYKAETNARYAAGELFYTYKYGQEWHMQRRIGVCTDHAAIFAILCNHAGIEAGVCSGNYKNRDGSTPNHSWNYAVIDGRKWYYDVDVEIQNYGKGQGDYYWYKKTRAEAEETHIFVKESA